MHHVLTQVLLYARGIWHYRWRALLVAWLVASAGWFYVLLLPDRYEAATRVYVDTESILRPLLQGLAVQPDVMTQINMMTTALLSRPRLENLARETDLYLRTQTPEQFDNLVTGLESRIRLVGNTRTGVYTITFTDTDRAIAQRVVETLLDSFVEDTLDEGRTESDHAQRFLETQIAEYERRLRTAEASLAQFKRENVGMMPNDRGDYYSRLQTEMQKLTELRSNLRAALSRRDEISRQISGEEPVFGVATNSDGPIGPTGSSFDARIAELQLELDKLLLRFTARHPDVVAIQETIQQLEARQADELANRPVSVENSTLQSLEMNPVFQQMRISLNETQVEIANLRQGIADQAAKVDELQTLVDTVPDVEARLVQLNRDYDVTKASYESLLERLETARLSEQVEQGADDLTFRILDPPLASSEPVYPNRGLFVSAFSLVGIVSGILMALFFAEVTPVFFTRRQLVAATGLPVLGAVYFHGSSIEQQRNKRMLKLFVLGCGALIVAWIVVATFSVQEARWLQGMLGGA